MTEWLGPQLHGEIHGEVDGTEVDVIAGASRVGCKREYVVPDPDDTSTYEQGWLEEIEISFYVTIDGVVRRYELEIYDFVRADVGELLNVVPFERGGDPIGGDEAHAEFQWEWEIDSSRFTYEGLAVQGTVEIRESSGMVGADGLVIPAGRGNFGALVRLEMPDGELGISFTAPCSIIEINRID